MKRIFFFVFLVFACDVTVVQKDESRVAPDPRPYKVYKKAVVPVSIWRKTMVERAALVEMCEEFAREQGELPMEDYYYGQRLLREFRERYFRYAACRLIEVVPGDFAFAVARDAIIEQLRSQWLEVTVRLLRYGQNIDPLLSEHTRIFSVLRTTYDGRAGLALDVMLLKAAGEVSEVDLMMADSQIESVYQEGVYDQFVMYSQMPMYYYQEGWLEKQMELRLGLCARAQMSGEIVEVPGEMGAALAWITGVQIPDDGLPDTLFEPIRGSCGD